MILMTMMMILMVIRMMMKTSCVFGSSHLVIKVVRHCLVGTSRHLFIKNIWNMGDFDSIIQLIVYKLIILQMGDFDFSAWSDN